MGLTMSRTDWNEVRLTYLVPRRLQSSRIAAQSDRQRCYTTTRTPVHKQSTLTPVHLSITCHTCTQTITSHTCTQSITCHTRSPVNHLSHLFTCQSPLTPVHKQSPVTPAHLSLSIASHTRFVCYSKFVSLQLVTEASSNGHCANVINAWHLTELTFEAGIGRLLSGVRLYGGILRIVGFFDIMYDEPVLIEKLASKILSVYA